MNTSGICIIVLIIIDSVWSHNDYNETIVGVKTEILSRRKRFLIFPEGSSFQLVFCTTYPLVSPIGDIILWGNTAALAWELPQDPYSPFDHHADPLHRRLDTKTIYYTSENGKVIYKRPYSRSKKLIVNPAFVKRSVDADMEKGAETKQKTQMNRKQMHASQSKREFLNNVGSSRSVEFHRSARASLYQKIEAVLDGLGADGRQCLLKTLCVVGKSRHSPQGSFLQEILRATFTLPQGFFQDDVTDYDAAFSTKKSCEELYPGCQEHISDPVLT